jgi:hypothetical protein
MVNSKHAFWIALVFTLIVFAMGLIFGYFFEGLMTGKTQENLIRSEISLLDDQIRNDALTSFDIDCNASMRSLFDFADSIYEEASQLEVITEKTKFTNEIEILHKRYDLLRMMLWAESASLKKKCGSDFHIVVYFFHYDPNNNDPELTAKQITYSRVLRDIKYENPSEVLLIPIAGNLDLKSINLVLERYNITELPSVLIDERQYNILNKSYSIPQNKTTILTGMITKADLEKAIS